MPPVTPRIFFYLPPGLCPPDLPTRANQNWAGYGLGIYAWTVQTYLQLRSAGIACELTQQLPEVGIVLCHSNILRSIELTQDLTADLSSDGAVNGAANGVVSDLANRSVNVALAPQRLLICMKAEAPLSAIAPIHIVQNPTEASPSADRYYLPHWPQPQMMRRDPSRGDRFENLAYFGHDSSLAPELKTREWQAALAERGMNWRVIANANPWNRYDNLDTSWNDYRQVDAIVAVRSFKRSQTQLSGKFSNKPPTKLYNAWLGGAIPILGKESAYRQTGQSPRDYLEVTSVTELLASLDRLKVSLEQRRSLLIQGQLSARNYTPDNIVRKWQTFLDVIAIPAYAEWCNYSPWQRRQALIATQTNSYWDRIIRRLRRLLT